MNSSILEIEEDLKKSLSSYRYNHSINVMKEAINLAKRYNADIDKCKYFVYENIEEFFSKNKGEYFFFTRYGHKPHSTVNFSKIKDNIYLIFGKESTGIPKDILKPHLDRCYRIPMTSNVRALNLSNSVAIAVYEVLRQKNYEGLLFDEPHKSKTYLED